MRRVIRYRHTGATVAVVAIVLLTACDNNNQSGPLAIRGAGNTIAIASCRPIVADAIFVEGERDSGDATVDVFEARGSFSFDGSGFYDLGDLPAGTRVIKDLPFARARGDQIGVAVSNDRDGLTAFFEVPGDRLSEKLWSHPDGTQSREPCP